MKKVILISPFSKKLSTGENPKNYPYWASVVQSLRERNYYLVQIGKGDESDIGCHGKVFDAPLRLLLDLAKCCDTWISIDNFFPHLCAHGGKPGIVIWGQSNPVHFGYPTNINLVKDTSYLRPGRTQFWLWEQTTFRPEVFVEPAVVVGCVDGLLEKR